MAGSIYVEMLCPAWVERMKNLYQLEWCPKIMIQEYWYGDACLYPVMGGEASEFQASLINIGKTLPQNDEDEDEDDDIVMEKDELCIMTAFVCV